MLVEAAEDSAGIKAIALRYLALREHSQQELLAKIQAKGFTRQAIGPVLAELCEQGWQSDARYAESYARHRIRKGFGPQAIRYELRQNGVLDVDLEAIMADIADSWLAQMAQVYAKKYRAMPSGAAGTLSKTEWAKRSRFLLQRGFPADLLPALLNHLNITLTSI